MITSSMSKIRTAVVLASLAVASGSTALHAQYQTVLGQVYVPFAFEVGFAHFAPGTYVLSDPQEHILSVRGPSGTALAMDSLEATLSPATESKVVFYKYGNRYFLREVWAKGETYHRRCPESKSEHRAKKIQQAANHVPIATPTNVEIALLENPR
jgi:hypothetical protein